MKKIYYIGTFPPPFGGVTVKNDSLYKALEKRLPLNKIDLSRVKQKRIGELLRFIIAITKQDAAFIVGVAGRRTRKSFCGLLYYINRKAMRRSLLIVMGGIATNDIASDEKYRNYVRSFKKVYVETEGMKNVLNNAGVRNVSVYPNGRFKPIFFDKIDSDNGSIKCVYFSGISIQKGVDLILDVAEKFPEIKFYFYGNIDKNYENGLFDKIKELSNCKYMGVFKGNGDKVYRELSLYDILLFPTLWETEGVPGILVESKIAGLAPIVTNKCFNAEIIKDGEEGIVMSEATADCLFDAINRLVNDRDLLNRMKNANHRSADRYYIENYIDEIVKIILD